MTTGTLFDHSYEMVLLDMNIDRIFDKYYTKLSDQRRKMAEQISNWVESVLCQIKDHMNEQQRLLDQEYANQQQYLEKKRQEYIDEALVYEKKKNDEQIRQLLAQCNALKFELTTFQYSPRTISYLTLIAQENPADEQPLSTLKLVHNDDTINSVLATESSPSTINIKQKNSQSLITEFSDESQSTIYRDDSIEECPICNMFFSSNMTPYDQNVHVNEHFSND